MDNQEFKQVDIIKYLDSKLLNMELTEITAIKVAPVMARRGVLGEKIVTYAGNNIVESVSTVKVDLCTGNPDWVLTKIDNNCNLLIDEFGNINQWIVSNENFANSYQPTDIDGIFRPIPKEQKFIQVLENITFIRPDGKSYSVEAYGYLNITNPNKIRVISKRDFEDTYEIINVRNKSF